MAKQKMTQEAVKRIQSATVEQNGGTTPKKSFVTRAQSTVAKKRK